MSRKKRNPYPNENTERLRTKFRAVADFVGFSRLTNELGNKQFENHPGMSPLVQLLGFMDESSSYPDLSKSESSNAISLLKAVAANLGKQNKSGVSRIKNQVIEALYPVVNKFFKPTFRRTAKEFAKAFHYEGGYVALFSESKVRKSVTSEQVRSTIDKAISKQFNDDVKVSAGIARWHGPVMLFISLRSLKKLSGYKKNPIKDDQVALCLAALAGMVNVPDRCEDVPEHILDALESEGLWSYEKGVTAKGRKFLSDAGWDESDEFYD